MRIRARSEEVRRYILEHVAQHPADIGRVTAAQFKITRQAINKHLQQLVSECALTQIGQTRSRTYALAPLSEALRTYPITQGLDEDVVWRGEMAPILGVMPENVRDIWHYGFTEMLNNAVQHSGGSEIILRIRKTAIDTEMVLMDNGVGIFKKLQTALQLLDERHAVLELAKGKLTTDPARHTGEGIFFTSRMFDSFDILSGGVYFTHSFGSSEDWILERPEFRSGTAVWMKLYNHTARTTRKVFDQFSSAGDVGFTKTVVPVKLAQYGDDKLISRSQAQRVLARVDRFRTVIFDFAGVPTIGQAFSDEIFRVFARAHPGIRLDVIHDNPEVARMIERAKSGAAGEA